MEATHVMEVAQLLLSLLHSWGLDPHLDKVCETQLGLLRPMVATNKHLNFQAIKLINFSDSRHIWRSIQRRLHVPATANMAK